MGIFIDEKERSLTQNERDHHRQKFRDNFDSTIPKHIESLDTNGRPLFGIEVEYHIVNSNGDIIPHSAQKLLSQNPSAVGEAVNFQLELVSNPNSLQNPIACLEEMVSSEEKLMASTKSTVDGSLLPMGVLPTFPTSMRLSEFASDTIRSKTIRDYIEQHMKPKPLTVLSSRYDDLIFGRVNGAGLINELHINISGCNDAQSTRLFNIASALSGPLVALSANSTALNREILRDEDSQISIYEQNIEENSLGVPRVGLFPYINNLEEYFKIASDFQPIFRFNEDDPMKSYTTHYSTIWPWVKAHVADFQRVEIRSISKQPTVLEDMAVTTFYLYSLLSLNEEFEKTQSDDKDMYSLLLVPEDRLNKNLRLAAADGYDAQLHWGRSIHSAGKILHHLYEKAVSYVDRHDIDPSVKDLLTIVGSRLISQLNPARVFRKDVVANGFDRALENYMDHTQNKKDIPYSG